MKSKKNLWIAAASSLFVLLFYHQVSGLNVLLFNLILLTGLGFLYRRTARVINPYAAAAALVSAGVIAFNGSIPAILLNFLSLAYLSAGAAARQPLIFAPLHAFYSVGASWAPGVSSWLGDETNNERSRNLMQKGGIALAMIGIAGVFLALYASSNKVFSTMLSKIDFGFVSLDILYCILVGTLLSSAFFRTRLIASLEQKEKSAPLDIYRTEDTEGKGNEYFAGALLLALLNLLILFVNGFDLAYFTGLLPLPDLSFSEAVHQGVFMLMLSIGIALAIILFFFRGALNFHRNSRTLRLLALAWIAQNMLMIADTAYKNALYIEALGLTYKRIGVFIYLVLSLAALLVGLLKLLQIKTTWYFFRQSLVAAFVILLASTAFNWSGAVTEYNMSWSVEHGKRPDMAYLLSLDDHNIGGLEQMAADPEKFHLTPQDTATLDIVLTNRIAYVKNIWTKRSWLSYNWCSYQDLRNAQNKQL